MKRYILPLYLLLLFPILSTMPLYAWDCYTYADGLIDNNVTTVAVNQEMVFGGTPLAGSRFDGARWESFLKGVEITKIVLDDNDRIWVGARQGLWEGYGEEWNRKLSDILVNDIVIEPGGKIWVATDNGILSSSERALSRSERALSRSDGTNWENYAHLDEQLAQVGLSMADSPMKRSLAYISAIPLSNLNWIKNYVTALALNNENELYAGVHIAFEVAKSNNVLLLSGIGFFDGYRWELLEPTLETRLLEFSAETQLEGRDKFLENALQIWRWKTPEAKKAPLGLFLLDARPITAVAVDKENDIWYSRWNRGVFRFDGENLTRYWSQDLDRNGIWDGEQYAVAAVDMDGDGRKEIVATAKAGYDQEPRGIYVYDADLGEERWQYRIGPVISPGANVAIGDVTVDPKLEVVVGGGCVGNGVEANGTDDSHGFLFILDHDGANLFDNGISKPLTDAGGGLTVAISDIDGDGVNEIIGGVTWNTYLSTGVTNAGIIISDSGGNIKHRYTHPTAFNEIGVANLDGQGKPEIIAADEEYLIQVFDANLSLLCEKQLHQYERSIRFIGIADLYGDGKPEIIFLLPGKLLVLNYRAEEKRLEELWSYSDFGKPKSQEGSPILNESPFYFPKVILSDVLPGGSVELIISADKIYILGADTESTGRDRERPLLTGRDSGWRYIETYDLARTRFYPYTPQNPLPEKPFVLKKIIQTKDPIQVDFTGDVNGDGVLELIGVVGKKIVVLSPTGEKIWDRDYRTERYFSVTALDDVFDTESPYSPSSLKGEGRGEGGNLEILASAFFEGHPQLLIIDGSNGAVIKNIPTEAGVIDKLHDNLVYDIEVDVERAAGSLGEGNLWFATSHDICQFDGVSWKHIQSSPDEQPVEVFALASDDSHNIWAGTSSGLCRLESRWTLYPTLPNNADPIDFQLDDKGDVWLATKGAGIFQCERNQLVPYLLDKEAHQVYSMMVDKNRGYIWGSSWTLGVDRGLFKIELKTGTAEKIKDERLINEAITAMASNNDGSLWLGGKKGLNLYNPDTGEWHSWTHEKHPDFLPNPDNDTINALYLAHDGKLWIGSKNSGIVSSDPKTDKWEKFTSESGAPSSQINAISEDESGGIWVATSNGACRFDPKTGKWRRFTMLDGLAGDTIYDLKVTGSNVWFATEGGVSKFDGTAWRTYDRRDGLPGNAVYTLAVEPSGTLWVGCRGGKVAVRRAESIHPDTFLQSKPLKQVGIASASFEFQGTDMGTSKNEFLYSYRLEPKEEIPNYPPEWLNWSVHKSDNRFFYEGLHDGTYTFYVKAIDKDDNVDPTPATYTFTVDTKPPMTLINQPVNEDWISGQFQIDGTVFDTDLEYYKIFVTPSEGKNQCIATGIKDATKRNEELATWDVSELAGEYRIRLEAVDELGHQSTDEITVFIENQPPEAKITYPTNDVYVGPTISIEGTARDDHFSRYILECEKLGTNTVETLIESSNPKDGILLANWKAEPRVGDYILRLKVFDYAGNKSSDSALIHIDNTPPVIYDVFPADGMDINDDSIFIHAFLSDGESGIDENSIVLEVDGIKQNTSFLKDESLLLCWISVGSLLPEIAHKLSIRYADKAGNQSSVFTVFKIFSSMQHLISRKFKTIYVHSPISEHGLVEVKRAKSEFWEILTPGMILTGADWVRMPHSGILSLKDTDNAEVYTLGRIKQKRIAELLLEGNIPTTSSPEVNGNLKLDFSKMIKPIPPFEDVPNIGKALWIFNQWRRGGHKEIQELSNEKGLPNDSPLLYGMLLEKANIPAHWELKDGRIYLLIDSGVPKVEAEKITVNHNLYTTDNPSSTVWLPLYISTSTTDFISAWYEGAQIVVKLKER